MYSGKFFKSSIKLLRNPFPVVFQTFFTQRALKGHLSTQKAVQGHLGSQDTQALKHLKHLGTLAVEYWRHSGTQDNWELRHWGLWLLEALKALYIANSSVNFI